MISELVCVHVTCYVDSRTEGGVSLHGECSQGQQGPCQLDAGHSQSRHRKTQHAQVSCWHFTTRPHHAQSQNPLNKSSCEICPYEVR